MTEEIQQAEIPTARVATRPGASGFAQHRRRLYQRHLLVFLAAGGALVALDYVTSPGIQWAHYLVVPWLLIFAFHTAGLRSRGYSFLELLVPPRRTPLKDVYTVPLDYELVRSRQIRDGIVRSAAAVRDGDAAIADAAESAANALLDALEALAASTRGRQNGDAAQAERRVPEAQKALETLDAIHKGLLEVKMLEKSAAQIPIDSARERAEAIRKLLADR